MFEKFEEIFVKVMEEKDIKKWYELYDSEDFKEVENAVTEMLGYNCWDSKEFCDWQNEMAMDLYYRSIAIHKY